MQDWQKDINQKKLSIHIKWVKQNWKLEQWHKIGNIPNMLLMRDS